jgi:hypothetical protein
MKDVEQFWSSQIIEKKTTTTKQTPNKQTTVHRFKGVTSLLMDI